MKILVLVPTYNESENIQVFLRGLLRVNDSLHVLVIDDSSPDGTSQKVKDVQGDTNRLHLLVRPEKEGLGPAYVAGMKWGLNKGYDLFVQMDADFSHRFEDLKKLLPAAQTVDFVVGARWIPEGKVENWGWHRRLLSSLANIYVRGLLGYKIHDWTGGFNVWHRHVLEAIQLDKLEAQGYCFQIEMKYRALQLNFQPKEVPIVFEERRHGVSKMSFRIIGEALLKVWLMRFLKKF